MRSGTSNIDIPRRQAKSRGTAGPAGEGGQEDNKPHTEDAGKVSSQKPVLILDYPSVMAQISPLHLKELTKFFEVVLIGQTQDLTQGDLEVMQINAVSFYYDYPDAAVREKFRRVIREIVREFSSAPAHYFSSLHWWAMEEASKAPTLILPAPTVRSIATSISRGMYSQITQLLEKFTIKIV